MGVDLTYYFDSAHEHLEFITDDKMGCSHTDVNVARTISYDGSAPATDNFRP